jgi:hypothetical protein
MIDVAKPGVSQAWRPGMALDAIARDADKNAVELLQRV